jgi:acyl-CoA thioesterase
MGSDSVQLILLQKHEAGFEHQAASMPDVPPPEKARIFQILLRYRQQKPQSTNNRLNTAPEFGGDTREASY